MSKETASSLSPFAALSYKEQQDRWMEWRSRQLDYRSASAAETEKIPPEPEDILPEAELPPLKLPNMRNSAPTRHRELDQVWARHQQAMRRAGAFHAITSSD